MLKTLENDIVRLTVDTHGAEIHSLIAKDTDIEYIWQADPNYWQRHAPILFPIVGKLKNGQYEYDGSVYRMSGHGFARDREFDFSGQTENSLTFTLNYDEETLKVYPFKFRLVVTYTLDFASVNVSWHVENLDATKDMYFSIGAHPAFNCPIGNEGSFDEHELEFEQTEANPITSHHINSAGLFDGGIYPIKLVYGKVLRLNHGLFVEDALVLKKLFSEEIKLTNTVNNHFVKVKFKGFPYLGIWTKPVKAPFICIEPWFGLADSTQKRDLSNKEGIMYLAPKKAFDASYTISIG